MGRATRLTRANQWAPILRGDSAVVACSSAAGALVSMLVSIYTCTHTGTWEKNREIGRMALLARASDG